MGMKQTLEVLNALVADKVVASYAVGGAIAAFNYVEATVTEDLDILVSFESAGHLRPSGLVTLGPILTSLFDRGYTDFHEEGIMIEGWPVQFLPVANDLDVEALEEAQSVIIDMGQSEGEVSTRILTPEHIVATALRVGRPKDRIRIMQFLEEKAVDLDRLCEILRRHDLSNEWDGLCRSLGVENHCAAGHRKP